MESEVVKIIVGSQIWLVPKKLASTTFRTAVDKLNQTKHGEVIEWTDDERNTFENVSFDKSVWMPL